MRLEPDGFAFDRLRLAGMFLHTPIVEIVFYGVNAVTAEHSARPFRTLRRARSRGRDRAWLKDDAQLFADMGGVGHSTAIFSENR